jgi:DNA mismatch repair protein MutL
MDITQSSGNNDFQQEKQLTFTGSNYQNHFAGSNIFMLKNKYIVTPVKSGLMLVNKHRAHERILFEQFMQAMNNNQSVSQVSLFPTTLNLNHNDTSLLAEIKNDLHLIGFDIREFGNNTFVVNATPAIFQNLDPAVLITHFLEIFRGTEGDIKENVHEKLSLSLAQAAAIDYNTNLNEIEMRTLIDNLFLCQMPNYSPGGKAIIQIMSMEEIEKKF